MRENAHTAQIFLRVFLKKPLRGMHKWQKKCSTHFQVFFSGRYFSYTFFLLEHNGVFSEHNRILSNHNRVFPEHNEVFPEHNEVFREHKYQENGGILHDLALVQSKSIKIEHGPAISIDCLDLYPKQTWLQWKRGVLRRFVHFLRISFHIFCYDIWSTLT